MVLVLALVQMSALAGADRTYSSAEAPTNRMRLRDGGNVREFTVALDELHIGRQTISVESQPNVASVRELAKAFALLHGRDAGLVLYPAGAPRHPRFRRLLVERGNSLQLARQHARKLIPNDPYFTRQWHLRNTTVVGGIRSDVNVTGVWDAWRGSNVLVAIVDDGVELTHEDIATNANVAASWDFNEGDADPTPWVGADCDSFVDFSNCHGTPVAGLVAAAGNNGVGVTGVAFEAQIAGLRLIASPTTDEEDAAAMSHRLDIIDISNNSWGAEDCEGSGYPAVLSGAGPLMRAAIRSGVENGRDGNGTIYVWAGGNGRACGDDVNYDGFANLVDVIAVGSVTSSGVQASFSEPGACLIAVAPSNGGGQAITSTDLSGNAGYNTDGGGDLLNPNYTSTFSGTSASTPMVSGVVALMLNARPELGHRDVKEILLRSGTRVQPGDADWHTNSAGMVHNHRFGGGLVNASNAVSFATNWLPLGPRSEISRLATNLAVQIPDADALGVSYTFTITNRGARVENAELIFSAPHSDWGDLSVTLTSPSGMRSRLAAPHTADVSYTYDAWSFNSVRHWGENARGDWTVTVADPLFGNSGVLDALELKLYVSHPGAVLSIDRLPVAETNVAVLTLSAPAPGWRYVIESVPELGAGLEWTEVASVTIPNSGRVTVLDYTEGTALPVQRFYRARLIE